MTFSVRTLSFAATATAALSSTLAYPFLPERVTTRFDVDGNPDRYGSRAAAAFGLPAMMGGITLVNAQIGAWPGGRDREDGHSGVQARDQAVGLITLAMLSAHLAILGNAAGLQIDMGRVNRGVYGVLMIGLGNIMPKLPRNWLIGIRTPWTLADPSVWERTHRLAGFLITAAGLVSLASLPATGKRAQRLPLVLILGAVGLSAAYSYVAHKRLVR